MRYFKIPLYRNFVWKVSDYSASDDTCQWCLRSKIGVWQLLFVQNDPISPNTVHIQVWSAFCSVISIQATILGSMVTNPNQIPGYKTEPAPHSEGGKKSQTQKHPTIHSNATHTPEPKNHAQPQRHSHAQHTDPNPTHTRTHHTNIIVPYHKPSRPYTYNTTSQTELHHTPTAATLSLRYSLSFFFFFLSFKLWYRSGRFRVWFRDFSVTNRSRKKKKETEKKKAKINFRVPARWRRRTGRPTAAGTRLTLPEKMKILMNLHEQTQNEEQREDRL